MRNRERLFNRKAQFSQPITDGFWVKVKIQFDEFNRLKGERIPILLPKPVTQNGFEI